MIKIGDTIKRVSRESFPAEDIVHKVARFNSDGTKVVLRPYRRGQEAGKAVTVKIDNIKSDRPTSGTFNGTFYEAAS